MHVPVRMNRTETGRFERSRGERSLNEEYSIDPVLVGDTSIFRAAGASHGSTEIRNQQILLGLGNDCVNGICR